MSVINVINKVIPLHEGLHILWFGHNFTFEQSIFKDCTDIKLFLMKESIPPGANFDPKLGVFYNYSPSTAYDFIAMNNIDNNEAIRKLGHITQLPIILILHEQTKYPKKEDMFFFKKECKAKKIIAPSEAVAKEWMLKPDIVIEYTPENIQKTLRDLKDVKHY